MSTQVKNGKSFEYSIIKSLVENEVGSLNTESIEKISKYYKGNNEKIKNMQDYFSDLAIKHIKNIEPNLHNKILYIESMQDQNGISGDVRDITISNENKSWEIGISAKNNSDSAKHSRLSKDINFGRKWVGIENSNKYFEEIKPAFELLESNLKIKWENLNLNKEEKIYVPILNAFIKELKYLIKIDQSLFCKNIISYLIGKKDFYKVIKQKESVKIQAYNFNGTLGKQYNNQTSSFIIPKTPFPTKISDISYKNNLNNTILIKFNKGWELSLRIHNASSKVEKSMKFDVKLIKIPSNIYTTILY